MKRVVVIVCFMTMYLVSVWAQDTVVISTNNNIVKDSVTSVSEHKPMPLTITPDTLSTKDKHAKALKNGLDTTGYKKIFAPDPNKAMWYGLICPGLGQIYNRKYWKLPIVYGGFVAFAYGISWNDRHYQMYKRYYRDIADDNPNTKSYEELYSKYDPSVVTANRLKDMMDNLRRYRDLCIIGTVAFYAITVLDAFVDASLANFDISPYLSLHLAPTMVETNYNNTVNPAIKLNLKF